MHKIQTSKGEAKHEVIFYDSDKVLPYRRYQVYNKHLMISSQVGNSIGDFDKRQSRAIMYLNDDDKKSAGVELTNQRQCFWNALQCYDPIGMAGATMVYSIDGLVYEDYTEEGLNLILDKFEEIGLTMEQLFDTVTMLKKK